MSTELKQTMTADEFLLWAEGKEGRWELHDGVPMMMSPERVLHGDTKGEAYTALKEAVRRARLPCKAYPDGVAVRIDAGTNYQPDASVSGGPRPAERSSDRRSDHRRRSALAEHRGDRPRPQAQPLFLAAERASLSHPRPRATSRHSPQARAGRGDRDAGVVERRRAARSTGVRGCYRGLVSRA